MVYVALVSSINVDWGNIAAWYVGVLGWGLLTVYGLLDSILTMLLLTAFFWPTLIAYVLTQLLW